MPSTLPHGGVTPSLGGLRAFADPRTIGPNRLKISKVRALPAPHGELDMMLRRTRTTLAIAALSALCLTGCSTTVAGTAVPSTEPPPAPALTHQNGFREFLPTLTTMRTWDQCALHDIAAAEAATGGMRRTIVPTSTLNRCTLSLTHAGSDHTWSIDVESVFDETLATGYERTDLAGTGLYRQKPPDEGTPAFGVSCSYFYPVQEPLGIKITAQTTDKDTRDAVCAITEKYVTALLPKLKSPPLTDAGLTTPMISLYGKDPCAALQPAQQAQPRTKRGQPTYVSGLNPYSCTLRSDGALAAKTTVQFESFFEEGGSTRMLGTHKAFVKDQYGDCEYRVPIDPQIMFRLDDPTREGYAPGVSIAFESGACDDALAAKVLDAALAQPAPKVAGATPQITLGKLV
ncbi:hypothetical protein [Pseudonocardia sp. GCM10023141]|uniref:hypothetical protein n=1 Tax=Pseudonocardia sp. GCM10023141 TaxID=3252653 RepID=UPI00360ECC7A